MIDGWCAVRWRLSAKVGDLVIHNGKQIGLITYIWNTIVDGGQSRIDVLFKNGEYHVNSFDCEVISESR